jgi:Holliday junction resolvase
MNRKAKGNRNEYKSIRLLETLGYEVFRMAGSLGAFDLIAICKTDFQLIQVKSNRMPGTAELETIRNFECPANARKLVHVWIDRKRLPVVKEV